MRTSCLLYPAVRTSNKIERAKKKFDAFNLTCLIGFEEFHTFLFFIASLSEVNKKFITNSYIDGPGY